ncbi:nuclear transport factor 2 family protein [Nocardia sp. NPDC051321]|uniref:nuclear transport factor 2 family protein n=1 Tax=Nocardia sp. NPDC051321 TaxID=3364323 RepID=UPI00379CDABA
MTVQTPTDTASVDSIIDALYDTVSGPAGSRDFDRLRALFLPDARLIPAEPVADNHTAGQALDSAAFIAAVTPKLSTQPCYEVEIARRTERFGPIAHAWSTYESRESADGEPFVRGINSIQLLHKDGRWWVVTIFWSKETEHQQIPTRYSHRSPAAQN